MYYQIAYERLKKRIQPLYEFRPGNQTLAIAVGLIMMAAIISSSYWIEIIEESFRERSSLVEYSVSEPVEAPEWSADTLWFDQKQPDSYQDKKATLLFFTYPNCLECIDASRVLRDLERAFADNGLQIVSIYSPKYEFEANLTEFNETAAGLTEFSTVGYEENLELFDALSDEELAPFIVLIDEEGQLRHFYDAFDSKNSLELVINDLVEAKKSERVLSSKPIVDPSITPITDFSLRFGSGYYDVESIVPEEFKDYVLDVKQLGQHEWGVSGTAAFNLESLDYNENPAALEMRFSGKEVWLVASAPAPTQITVSIADTLGGQTELSIPKAISIDKPGLYKIYDQLENIEDARLTINSDSNLTLYSIQFR